ncbi:MAG: hypothetical protein IT381_31000 [Deltaproteobacteria bacterium]|nr:hypothetical protein [Deltaproteobacteria bacterium]
MPVAAIQNQQRPSHINYRDKKDSVLSNSDGAAGQAWRGGDTSRIWRKHDGTAVSVPSAHDVLENGLDIAALAKKMGLESEEALAILEQMGFDSRKSIGKAEMAELVTAFKGALASVAAEVETAFEMGELTTEEYRCLKDALGFLTRIGDGLTRMNDVFTKFGAEIVYLDK